MAQLANKVALVTGGASGIGAACARRLAAEDVTVVLTDVQDPMGEALAAEIGGLAATSTTTLRPRTRGSRSSPRSNATSGGSTSS